MFNCCLFIFVFYAVGRSACFILFGGKRSRQLRRMKRSQRYALTHRKPIAILPPTKKPRKQSAANYFMIGSAA